MADADPALERRSVMRMIKARKQQQQQQHHHHNPHGSSASSSGAGDAGGTAGGGGSGSFVSLGPGGSGEFSTQVPVLDVTTNFTATATQLEDVSSLRTGVDNPLYADDDPAHANKALVRTRSRFQRFFGL